jgi:antirestriction protein ArdC
MTTPNNQPFDVYQIITDQIIAQLNNGIIPWHQPWGDRYLPQNLISKHGYRGINQLLLSSLNFPDNYFLTWDQLQKCKGSVKKGEKGHIVVFWKVIEKEVEGKDEKEKLPVLRYFKVFNVSQCTNIPETILSTMEKDKENLAIPDCSAFVDGMPQKPVITSKGNGAWYDPVIDTVNVPPLKKFKDSVGYYGTLFHELVHSTGHASRLNRKEITEKITFGSPTYSQEELTAEIGASFLLSFAGIAKESYITNSAAYVQGWLKKLQNDKRCIIHASTYAQKAADFILKMKPEVQQNEA